MRWRLMLFLVAAVVIVGGAFSFHGTIWHSKPHSTDPGAWPVHLSKGVELPKGEELRHVDYYPGGNTPKYALAEHQDGQLSHYWYRSTGKLREAKTFSRVNGGKRALLRHAFFEVDGANYLLDMQFYADGVMKKLTQKITDTVTFRWHYFDTGELELFENFEKTDKPGLWLRRIADTYRKDGSLAENFVRRDKNTWESRTFNPEMKLLSVKIKSDGGYVFKASEYFPDGETVRRKIEQYSSYTEDWLYHPNSQVYEHRKWIGTVSTGTLYFDRFDPDGAKTLEQVWNFDEKVKAYTPMWIIAFEQGKAKYRFWFTIGTSRLRTIQHFYTDKEFHGLQSHYSLSEDGKVEEMSDYDGNTLLELAKYEPEHRQPHRFNLDANWFVMKQTDLPPQEVPYDPGDR